MNVTITHKPAEEAKYNTYVLSVFYEPVRYRPDEVRTFDYSEMFDMEALSCDLRMLRVRQDHNFAFSVHYLLSINENINSNPFMAEYSEWENKPNIWTLDAFLSRFGNADESFSKIDTVTLHYWDHLGVKHECDFTTTN